MREKKALQIRMHYVHDSEAVKVAFQLYVQMVTERLLEKASSLHTEEHTDE